MRIHAFVLTLASLLFFSACSSKQYFDPDNTYSASHVSFSYGENIIDLSRHGATLSNGAYIGQSGVTKLSLGEGYRFLNENNKYALATNPQGKLKIIDKAYNNVTRNVDFHTPIVSASMRGNIVAYILNNNTFGLYDMSKNHKMVENRSEQIFAIDTRSASPLFVENLVVMPMLDGKIVIVSIANPKNAKVVYISNDKTFNNVIHLSRLKNTMVSATPTRLITLGKEGQLDYRANISEVIVAYNKIYIFTKDGSIMALNNKLEVVSKNSFKFAHYAVATAFDNKVYALDQQGALIVLNASLSKSKVYDLGKLNEPAFITGKILYKDGEGIALSKLGYE
ncbi:Putative lipoprotein [hydrothermal vent metagenome]|uniref:Putative lipoprotein n=1 Tax=hydrothermal vent metagenome TaxID=652676 RepID=A0A1W1CGW0_9ZZZZ